MRTIIRRSLLIGALTLPALACSDTVYGPNGERVVRVKDDSFDPFVSTIAQGEGVYWLWSGSHQHNVTWVVTSGVSNSATQTAGDYTRNFLTAGSYSYYCTVHGTPTTGMRGTVVVEAYF